MKFLPEVRYRGVDANGAYIRQAKARFHDRGTFVQSEAADVAAPSEAFDIVLAQGVLHHLSDSEAASVFRTAYDALIAGGRLITLDGCFEPRQNPLARFMLVNDRGRYVRDQDGYVGLARQAFSDVRVAVRRDLMHVPYTYVILECTKTPARPR